jgi:general stress protein 26
MDDEIRDTILALMDRHRIMTIATLRPDGWPQVTTVSYMNEGLTLYFFCGAHSQKAANLAEDDRVSLAIADDTSELQAIAGLSMAAHAEAVTDPAEADRIVRMILSKYPEPASFPVAVSRLRVFRLTPTAISVIDYSQGFGHAELLAC